MNTLLISWEWNLLSTSLVVLVCIFFIVIILSIFNYFISDKIDKKHNLNIAFNSEKKRIFTLHTDTSTLSYFDKQDMRNRTEMNLSEFYRGLESEEQAEKMKKWIDCFINGGTDQSTFLSLSSRIKSTGKDCISLYHITSFNAKKKVLHFEKTTLPGVSTKSNRRSNKDYIKPIDKVESLIKSNKRYRKNCYVIYVKLNHKTGKVNENKNEESYTYYSIYQPLISIYRYLSKKIFLSHIDEVNACIFDFQSSEKSEVEEFCKKIISKIERYFNLKAIPSLYTVSIGCAQIKNFNLPLSKTIDYARSLAGKAGALEGDSNYVIEGSYKKIRKATVSQEEILDIKSLISNKTMRCYFTPILFENINRNVFVSTVKPYGTKIDDFDELCDVAKNQGMLKEVLKASFENIKEAMGDGDYEFVFKAPFNRVYSIIKALKNLPRIKSKMYLLLELSELADLDEEGRDVNKYFEAIERAKIRIALNFDDVKIDVPKGILSKCELFLINVNSEGLHSDERTKSELITYKALLQDYNRPIVVDKMLSTADMLFAKDLGYDSFICESIAGSSSSPYIPENTWKEDIEKLDEVDISKKDEKDSSEEVVKEDR